MKEIIIKRNDAGSRFDKFLKKLFVNASGGFLYKMLRKKNITLNNAKADGSELLKEGDVVKVFFSDETYDKFVQSADDLFEEYQSLKNLNIQIPEIIYENDDILLINKPKNLLSQKAEKTDISANEILLSYMIKQNMLSMDEFKTFKPSVCNRLDQNTTGILIFGKSKKGLQEMSLYLKERTAHKFYYALVKGKIEGKQTLKGYLSKNEANNTVNIAATKENEDDSYIETVFKGLAYNEHNDVSLLEIELITGKTHQIRAHLAYIGHPIIGDYKYGNRKINDAFKDKYHIDSQLLHAYRLILPEIGEVRAKAPAIFDTIMNRSLQE